MNDSRIVEEWFRFAHNDLTVAKRCIEDYYPKQTEIACYLSQQCAEKAIKGFLVYKNVDPPQIHNLRTLCKLCGESDTTFDSIIDICSDLTPFNVTARYPNELAPDETIANLAVKKGGSDI
jgi:HEPN domain-containing protein